MLNQGERDLLDKPITLEELHQVLKGCGDTSPGPDGIPYKVYRKLWTILGPFLLDSWKYSVSINILPNDQRVSAITLLPKQGKPVEKIENWRPITLSNCDLKIFTKLLSNRVSKVLDKLIHPSPTAYIPGRVVHDNLRLFEFYNKYCRDNDIDAVLVSLDARKAFDSVSHKYLHRVLSAYGFSEDFISTIKLLYNDIKAHIMVNGYKSACIRILRCLKQGDALSCALFILCIDPLIRKIENNPEIKPPAIPRSRLTGIRVGSKIAGFADDIGAAISNDRNSILNVFSDYALFSSLSGIELNIEKTEILKLNYNSLHQDFQSFPIEVNNEIIYTKESITICGICFSNNTNLAYDKNILDKIVKMERQLIIWLQRPLSIEGKSLIVKTFGLSQLIYSLQMCAIEESELTNIERMIFKFLWNKKWVGSIAPDRIKRTTLKQPFEKGGLAIPDIRFLNNALKVKQFIRAMKTSHPINLVQRFQLERVGYDDYFKCEYAKICQWDPVIRIYQTMCNQLTDGFRGVCSSFPLPDPNGLDDVINVIASTDVLEYLKRKNELLIINRFGALINVGICSYRELLNEAEFPRNDDLGNLANYILTFFPSSWPISVLSGENVNSEITYDNEFPSINLKLVNHKYLTVKSIRKTLCESLPNSPHPYTYYNKFQLTNVNNINPFILLRKNYHTPRDRFFKYRILQGDIFCNERLHRFRLVDSPLCTHCNNGQEIESIKHVLWDCNRAQNVWNYLNSILEQTYNTTYITYDSVVLGSISTIQVAESMILTALKLILVKDRSTEIAIETVKNRIKAQFIIEQNGMKNKRVKFQKKWSRLEPILFPSI